MAQAGASGLGASLLLLFSCLKQEYFGPPAWLRHSMVWTSDNGENVPLFRWLAWPRSVVAAERPLEGSWQGKEAR